ncbi:MAG: carboxymuconolactone decarboxylase family protein [Nitrospinota bacterium]
MGLTEEDLDAAEDSESGDRFTEAERIALRYAEQMQLDPSKIRGDFYDELRKHYTNEEIMELGVFVAFNLGFHSFFSTLEFLPAWDHVGKEEKTGARE